MKHELIKMAWTEAKETFQAGTIAFLPIGTLEPCGPHNPMGNDGLVAEYMAKEVAKRTNSIVLPLIPYGCSRSFRNFPGCLWLRPEVLEGVVYDVVKGLDRHGCKGLVIVNNHGPNQYPVEQAVRNLMDETSMKIISFWPSMVFRATSPDIYESRADALGHGGEPSTSILMAIAEDGVAEDRMVTGVRKPNAVGSFQVRNSNTTKFKGVDINWFLDMDQVTQICQTGSSEGASADKGQLMLDRAVDWAVQMVEAFKEEMVKL